MHYTTKTRMAVTVNYLLASVPTPVGGGYKIKLDRLGRANITSVKEIQDWLELSPRQFVAYLLRTEGAIEAYRNAKVNLKMQALENMLDIATSDPTEKSITSIQRAWEFITHNVARTTLDADKLLIQRAESSNRMDVSMAALKLNKRRLYIEQQVLKLRQDESFIRIVTDKDEETLRKIQRHIAERGN